jgi:hypothetical protein
MNTMTRHASSVAEETKHVLTNYLRLVAKNAHANPPAPYHANRGSYWTRFPRMELQELIEDPPFSRAFY